MGAAGDMLTASLLELLDKKDRKAFVERLGNVGIPGVSFEAQPAEKCGITGTRMTVLVNGTEEGDDLHDHDHSHDAEHVHVNADGSEYHHSHSSMHGIEHIVMDHLNVSDKVKKDIMEVYSIIAEAESSVHGVPVSDIHFHEVGTMDAVADVTAVCMLMEQLAPDLVLASPVHVGAGTVKCAHGILPVPAPATALILKDVPIYGGQIKSELCTPTGAALLKHFVNKFTDMPVMTVSAIGYGMGKKDFERANCVRTMLGESEGGEYVTELSCNVDDMTAEEIGFAMDILLKNGALEVYTIPIGMKKCRPGTLICVMCRESDCEKMTGLIFRHTTTLGIRENVSKRYTLKRSFETIETEYGPIRLKRASGWGVTKEKYEYDDLANIAAQNGISISEIKKIINK